VLRARVDRALSSATQWGTRPRNATSKRSASSGKVLGYMWEWGMGMGVMSRLDVAMAIIRGRRSAPISPPSCSRHLTAAAPSSYVHV
jgi:hypothetical protein